MTTVIISLRKQFVEFPVPLIMGILNVTPDSFSDGGRHFGLDAARRHADAMAAAGARIIDVGGESTRPGARRVDTDEEIDRVIPVIEKIKSELDVLVSIDTYKEPVARIAVEEAGADMINDISALRFSEKMADTVAELEVPVVLMHIKGTPEDMQIDPSYADVIAEIDGYFEERIEFAQSKGIKREKLIIDPGIGFGKRLEDNVAIIRQLNRFDRFELPILVGLSHKTFLGKISGSQHPEDREPETIAASVLAVQNGAAILRVHDVAATVKAMAVLSRLMEKG